MKRCCLVVLFFVLGCLKPAGVRYEGLPTVEEGALHIVVFDVGQADAMLVMHRGKSLLVDAGTARGEPRKPEQRIPRRLDALLGKRHLDYFMVSHYHKDHLGGPGGSKQSKSPTGLFALIEREGISIGTMLDRGGFRLDDYTPATQRHYERAVTAWLATGAVQQRRELLPGESIDMGPGLEMKVIATSGNGQLDRLRAVFPSLLGDYPPTENDYSVGFKITLGDFELFSAGDLSGRNVLRQFGDHKESYNDMESRLARDVGPVEIYRVNHHGSAFSSNSCFVEVLAPMLSVISTGENGYGHPDPEVYGRLKQSGEVRITGGADRRVRSVVAADIVGDDVEIVVAPDGKRFWVNGQQFESRDEAAELAARKREACDDTLGEKHGQHPYEAADKDEDVPD